MDIPSLIIFLAIGAAAGWIAGQLTKGRGFGLFVNTLVGIVGAVLGGLLFEQLGIIAPGLIGTLVAAVIGAIVLLFVVRLIKRA
ncbi:MAG: GlsB/YeaQ/YmgE family stress response membrane protein [Gammaproteobacteria bacterium]|jgi:uncharacterized membrane protein YeaQ/YmgE (transglycosylase-associated protein family)|nr:GlsB/YeaQ/YmgE family stress response membrane protein [Gammaproteobacteria bacterium]